MNRHEGQPAEASVLSGRLLATRWVAYGLMLTSGVLLLDVIPAHDSSVSAPPTPQHAVQTTSHTCHSLVGADPAEAASPSAPQTRVGAHLHTRGARESRHEVHIRLSPRQLSLAKW